MDERALSAAALPQQRPSVFGTVTDSGIAPVPQAVVTLADMAGRKVGWSIEIRRHHWPGNAETCCLFSGHRIHLNAMQGGCKFTHRYTCAERGTNA